jgi:HAD superfamily phosphatase
MEDGPVKPDPAPVKRALQQLGVRHAWMIGDTPDDMNAARAAGVVPLAVVAPADDRREAQDKLRQAAAVRILDHASALRDLLDRIKETHPS